MNDQVEKPVIIIISAGKIAQWNGEVEISNVAPTTIYLNYNHHSVLHLRKRLTLPQFAEMALNMSEIKKPELLTVDAITKLSKEYIDAQVFTQVFFKYVDDSGKWFYNTCTTCDHPTEFIEGIHVCKHCPRTVPHPEKRYTINVVAYDATGTMDIILGDREVRTLMGKRARDIINEQNKREDFPPCLKLLAKRKYTLQLRIKEVNVVHHYQLYLATNICNGFVQPGDQIIQTSCEIQPSSSQATSSTYHLQGMSDSNFKAT
ncbi:hypothetical protein POM88_053684 [Heracleum sosnowskyi]|uniref:Replication factor A C-terminal domain-containing protein n=1 Tax=Heracleum sosnowskyi TaxID=360622 RepID=A0AAD8GPR3_9APIA|nr:hypothetical protein POM88_053684 [Heracleum sosnowskyi]